MSKNFSVAWLSLSSQLDRRTDLNAALERSPAPPALQTKHPSQNGVLLSDDNVKDLSNSPSSPTDSSGYISGSESEVGDDSEEESAPNRRIRTKFTSYQIARLEKTFHRHKYLGANRRRKIAEKLHLSETQVKTWFQNRRMKLKREAQDARVEYYTHALLAPLILSPPPFQHHPLAGQPLAFLRCFPQVNRMVSVQQHTPSLPMIHPLLPMLTLCSSPL